MRILLDTHAFLWWESEAACLPEPMRTAIADPENQVYVSAVSIWEIAIKRATGKLVFSGSAAGAIHALGFLPLPITPEDAEAAGALPVLHRDPFDRLLVAQALGHNLLLATVDELILRYEVPRL